jgi:hypothetical protein
VALLSDTALPEIGTDGTDAPKLAEFLRKAPEGVTFLVKEALSRIASDEQQKLNLVEQPVPRLALGLDQLEEIFTLTERFNAQGRRLFFRAIAALTESGYGWVVATLRSDFFSRCEEIPELMELKHSKGQYHLLPPNAADLSQIIRYPAEFASAVFEEDPVKGRLDDRIRDDALPDPGGLPLLEYVLDELFRVSRSDGVLRHADYDALGGVEGALRKRADETFAKLRPWEKEALDSVLLQLISLEPGSEQRATRRTARYETLKLTPGAIGLVEAFIQARLFTADQNNAGERTVTVAHEALVRAWPPIENWLNEHRKLLQARARLVQSFNLWCDSECSQEYLLNPGRQLTEAEEVIAKFGPGSDPAVRDYVLASKTALVKSSKRRPLLLLLGMVVIACVIGKLLALNPSFSNNDFFLYYPFVSAVLVLGLGMFASVMEVLREKPVIRKQGIAELGPTHWLLLNYCQSVLLLLAPVLAYTFITFWLLKIPELGFLCTIYLWFIAACGAAIGLLLCSIPRITAVTATVDGPLKVS